MANPTRIFTGTQFADLRAIVDPIFNTLHDELEDCYYGPKDEAGKFIPGTGWRNGVAGQWIGVPAYDVQATPELSKALFDRLQGLLWTVYSIFLADENNRRGNLYPDDAVDPVNNLDLPQNQREKRRTGAKRILREAQAAGFDLATFKTALAARGITFSEN